MPQLVPHGCPKRVKLHERIINNEEFAAKDNGVKENREEDEDYYQGPNIAPMHSPPLAQPGFIHPGSPTLRCLKI